MTSARRGLVLILCALGAAVALCAAPLIAAQPNVAQPSSSPLSPDRQAKPAGARPAGSGRIVQVFDFEESAFNPEPVPRYWFRAQDDARAAAVGRERPGFPRFNAAAFDHEVAYRGQTSVRLPTSGGSTSLRLSSTVIPVFADADYLLSAMVRTTDLRHARAVLAARLLTQSGVPIAGSEVRSAPVYSPSDWTSASVAIPGRYAAAAFVQIELLLLQPEQLFGPALPFAVPSQDITGAAWFDDVTLYQLPRVALSPRGGKNIFFAPTPPAFSGIIRDLTGEDLTIRLILRDVDGRTLADETRTIPAGGQSFDWAPALPALGWYEATMDVMSGSAIISRSRTTVVWMPAPRHAPAGESLSSLLPSRLLPLHVLVDRLDARDADQAGSLLAAAGAASVTLPIDDALLGGADAPDRAAELSLLIDRLLASDAAVTLALNRLPPDVATRLGLDPTDPLPALTGEQAQWLLRLQPLLDIYGQRVARWQIGAPVTDLDEPPAPQPRLARLAAFKIWLSGMVPGPILALPTRADWPYPRTPAGAPDEHVLLVPASFPPAALVDLGRDLLAQRTAAPIDQPDLTALLELPAPDTYGQRALVIDALQRAVALWSGLQLGDQPLGSALAPPHLRLGFAQPWEVDPSARPALLPTAALPALRTLADHLAGRRVLGELKTRPGIRALILSAPSESPDHSASRTSTPGPGGALVAWVESSQDPSPTIRTYLGDGPLTRLDAFGNSEPVAPRDASNLYEIALTPTPTFIENVDPELALFMTGLAIDPDFVPAVAAVHEHQVVLRNPWGVRISGTIQLIPQSTSGARATWEFTPTAAMAFTIPPGATQRLPISFTFPASEEAGPRSLQAVVRLTALTTYAPLRASLPITIGSPDLDVSVLATLGSSAAGGAGDVIVTVTVTNNGRVPRTLEVDAQAPRQAQQRRPISNLAPGESSVKRFVFAGAAASLSGRRVRVTVADVDGAERLNRSALVP